MRTTKAELFLENQSIVCYSSEILSRSIEHVQVARTITRHPAKDGQDHADAYAPAGEQNSKWHAEQTISPWTERNSSAEDN